MNRIHLAELNIARPKFANDDPHFADFTKNLARINALAFHLALVSTLPSLSKTS